MRKTMLRLTVCAAVLIGVSNLSGAAQAENMTMKLAWQFGYDEHGDLTKLVGPGGDETSISFARDEQGRLKQVTRLYCDGSKVSHEFDAFGRYTRMTDRLGTTEYGHDAFGRLAEVRRAGSPVIQYAYDVKTGSRC